MKSFLPLLSLAVVFSSCTTAYKSGQTPDDVYFSPERPKEEYVRVQKTEDRRYQGQDYYSYEDDRYLRMRVRNRNQWSYLDEYYRDPYAYNYYSYNRNYYYNSYYNPRTYWNCYYNPYAPTLLVNPRTPVYNRPRTYNLHVFDNPQNDPNPKFSGNRTRQYAQPSDQIRTSGNTGNGLRNVFGNSENNRTYDRSSNTTNNNTSSSNRSEGKSSNSSGNTNSGGNAPVRRF